MVQSFGGSGSSTEDSSETTLLPIDQSKRWSIFRGALRRRSSPLLARIRRRTRSPPCSQETALTSILQRHRRAMLLVWLHPCFDHECLGSGGANDADNCPDPPFHDLHLHGIILLIKRLPCHSIAYSSPGYPFPNSVVASVPSFSVIFALWYRKSALKYAAVLSQFAPAVCRVSKPYTANNTFKS